LYARTNSKLVLAAVGFAQVIPVVLLFVPAGTIVDRLDRRALATAAATTTGVIGLGLAPPGALAAPGSLYPRPRGAEGCVTAIHAPAVASLMPMIIARDQLVRANRISSSLSELASIVGPALAGGALALVSASWVYAALAITGLSAGALYRSLPRPRPL